MKTRVHQIKHLRTHRKGPKTGKKYPAGKKPLPFKQALKRSKRALTNKLTRKDLEYLRNTANQLTKNTFPPPKGFLIPALISADEKTTKRWEWHLNNLTKNKIILPIPQIKFLETVEPNTMKMLRTMTNTIKEEGHYGSQAAEKLVEWLAWGFAIKDVNNFPITQKVNDKLKEQFKLQSLLENPSDYFAVLLAESGHSGGPGWFGTPMNITTMMTQILFNKENPKPWEGMNEPCLGTGSMLLPASNYCLNMTGQDISPIMILTAKVNFTLYIPWAVVPYPDKMLKKLEEESKNGTAK
jgi:type I restriction-modification system DNA methylase subunit